MAVPKRALLLGLLAQQQHGCFTRRQATEAGFSLGEIDGRVKRQDWMAIDHGVYRSAATPTSWRQRLISACLAGPAVASHRAAGALWNFPNSPEEIVEISALRHRRRKSPDIVWHESVRFDDRDVGVLDAIPVTRPTRTIIDLAAVLSERELLRAVDDAVRRRLTSIARLQVEIERWGNQRRGIGRARRVIGLRLDQPIPESVLETEFGELISKFDLPTCSLQWSIRDDANTLVGRVDFAYPAARVAIEIDGAQYHDGFADAVRDRERQNRIESLGWRVLRFDAQGIRKRPDDVAAQILTALRHSPASLDPPDDGERRNRG